MSENVSEVHYVEVQWGRWTCQDAIPPAIVWGRWSTLMEAERTLTNPCFLDFFQGIDADHWSTKTLYKSLIGWPLVCVLLIPPKNVIFLFKAINLQFIWNLLPVKEEDLFSPKQGRGQEALLLPFGMNTNTHLQHTHLNSMPNFSLLGQKLWLRKSGQFLWMDAWTCRAAGRS